MTRPISGVPSSVTPAKGDATRPDMSQRVIQTYMVGFFLAVNAIRDVYALVEGPDCVHMKTQYVQGNHDWLSTLTSVSGFHRIANTALHPVQMTGSRERLLSDFLTKMARHEAVEGVLFTSMPMAFITGADYERLCGEVAEATGKSLVHVKGKSLSGDWLDGYAEVLLSLARQLDLSGGNPDPNKVAIIGNLFDRNEGDHRANVRDLRALLEALGLEVTSIWLEGGNFRDLAAVRDAGTVLSFPYGRRAAKQVAKRTGAHLLECELPFGLGATERFVRQLGAQLGRHEAAEAYIDRELAEVVPALEWVIPFLFQNRQWGYIGDPHLARGIKEMAELLGARLSFAVITNQPSHLGDLERVLGDETSLLVYPRQRTMSGFVSRMIEKHAVGLVVSHSEGNVWGEVALLELGYPSMYRHCLYDRPFLGFRGFLAVVDSMANALRQQEIRDLERRRSALQGRTAESARGEPASAQESQRPSVEEGAPQGASDSDAEADSPSPSWLGQLFSRFKDQDLPVRQLLAADGSLDVILDAGDGVELTVEFRPREENARSYRTTQRFLVRYRGVRDLSPDCQRMVDTVIGEIAGVEAELPEWRGVASAGDLEEEPPRAFARRFHFAQLDRSWGKSGVENEVLIRLTPACNQDCAFCSAPPQARPPSSEAVRDCVDWVANHLPGARVSLTGGEPTLRSTFGDEVRHTLSREEISRVLVQTNAVRLASEERVAELPGDDRLGFFVSLHAVDPEVYDRCTGSEGQLPLALRGLRNLLATGRRVTVNTVVTSTNIAHLPEMITGLSEMIGDLPKPVIHFSALICPPHRPAASAFLVRYSELTPVVETQIERAAELGFPVEPLVSSTHASIPLCLASPAHATSAAHRPELGAQETGYEDLSRPWVKANRCRQCSMTQRCLGVPAPYAQRFGLDELRPIAS